jgi:hypothetical protein
MILFWETKQVRINSWFDFNGFTKAQYDFILGICGSDGTEKVHHFSITQTLKFSGKKLWR